MPETPETIILNGDIKVDLPACNPAAISNWQKKVTIYAQSASRRDKFN